MPCILLPTTNNKQPTTGIAKQFLHLQQKSLISTTEVLKKGAFQHPVI